MVRQPITCSLPYHRALAILIGLSALQSGHSTPPPCAPNQCAWWNEDSWQQCGTCVDGSCFCSGMGNCIPEITCTKVNTVYCTESPVGGIAVKATGTCGTSRACYPSDVHSPCNLYTNPCDTLDGPVSLGPFTFWIIGGVCVH